MLPVLSFLFAVLRRLISSAASIQNPSSMLLSLSSMSSVVIHFVWRIKLWSRFCGVSLLRGFIALGCSLVVLVFSLEKLYWSRMRSLHLGSIDCNRGVHFRVCMVYSSMTRRRRSPSLLALAGCSTGKSLLRTLSLRLLLPLVVSPVEL